MKNTSEYMKVHIFDFDFLFDTFLGFYFANSLVKYKLISDVQKSCFMFYVIEIHVENVGRINQHCSEKNKNSCLSKQMQKIKT